MRLLHTLRSICLPVKHDIVLEKRNQKTEQVYKEVQEQSRRIEDKSDSIQRKLREISSSSDAAMQQFIEDLKRT